MLIEKIRQSTRQAHQELDYQVYPIVQQIQNSDSYIKLLKSFYGFYKPIYGLLNLYLSNEIIPGYTSRRQPSILINDINYFSDTAIADLCSDIPVITNTSQALGAFYVMEGSTMGGPIISKKISGNLGLSGDEGVSFFKGYGEKNREMWNNFLVSLNEQEHNVDVNEIIFTADKTFSKFSNWIIYCYAAKPTVTS